MIKTVTIKNYTNSAGDLVLTMANPELSGFAIVDISGLGPVQATYSSNDWVTIDGSNITSLRTSKREINMELRFIPTDTIVDIAELRKKSYLHFPIKNKIGLIFTCVDFSGKETNYFIEGYVTKNDQTMWSSECGCEITIICPDPYFSDVEYTEESFSQMEPKLAFAIPDNTEADANIQFPISERLNFTMKEIYSIASIDVGAIFTITAHGIVKNPAIYNETTYEQFALNCELTAGDIVEIDTRPGHRSVTLKEGLGKNYIAKMGLASEWIRIAPGANLIGLKCDYGFENIEMSYKITPLYVGL